MPRTYGSVEDQPDHVKEIYAQAKVHYDHLYQYRLKADETVAAPA